MKYNNNIKIRFERNDKIMGEALGGLKRTMYCGLVREANIGETITLMGWVQRNRKLGGLEFIDLRDREGIMQIVFGEEINAEAFEKAKTVKPEYCIAVTGKVVKREAVNENMPTGMVELLGTSIKILSESETPPIMIKEGLDASEQIRLKYRYLDLRRPDMQKIFMIRNKTTKAIRDFLVLIKLLIERICLGNMIPLLTSDSMKIGYGSSCGVTLMISKLLVCMRGKQSGALIRITVIFVKIFLPIWRLLVL